MRIEFVSYEDGEPLYTKNNVQHIPSKGEEVCIPNVSILYKVVERSFHYHYNSNDDCVLIWIKDIKSL